MGQSSIFTTGVEKILEQVDEIEIVGVVPATIGEMARIDELQPDVVLLINDDNNPAAVDMLLAQILTAHPDLLVIVSNLAEEMLHICISQHRVAQGPGLIAAICNGLWARGRGV
jgi:AmiR/NasT family two-component response regulator